MEKAHYWKHINGMCPSSLAFRLTYYLPAMQSIALAGGFVARLKERLLGGLKKGGEKL